jgi:F0F1-type ATP synthase assembly protein I
MQKSFVTVGEIVAPIVFMMFIGYQLGKYIDQMVVSIVICMIVGFIVAVFNVWKLMKRLEDRDE